MRAKVNWLVIALVVGGTASGCAKVVIAPGAHAVVAEEPTGDEVSAYSYLHQRPEKGPFLAFEFNSGHSDLRKLSNRLGIHKLYFAMSACSEDDRSNAELALGIIHEVPPRNGLEIPHRYKVFIPLDLKEIKRVASVVATLDAEKEVDKSRSQGMCLRVGGGTMWGAVLESNSIRLPLAVVGDELNVTAADPSDNRVPNSALNPSHSAVTALAQGSKRRAVRRAG